MSLVESTKVLPRIESQERDSSINNITKAANAAHDVVPSSVDEETEEWKPTTAFLLALLALCTLSLAVAIDATSVSVALPVMSEALGGTALQAFWTGTSFLLASTVLQPSVASMSNIVGRKYMIYASCLFFAVGSLIAALAGNFVIVLVGRTIQGIGGGSIIALTEVVVTDLIPLAHRPTFLSILSAMWSVGTVTGPLIGAGFAQNISWRWIFYVNLPIIGLGLVFVVLFLHQVRIPGHVLTKLAKFDWIGSFLFTIGATAFLFGVSVGGVMYEWSSWNTLLPLILGPVIILAFAVWELRYAAEPIINRRIFSNWTLIATYIQTILHGIVLWSLLYFLVLYYQACKSYGPIISAVAILPETLTVAPSGVFVGVVTSIILRYRWGVWSGWTLVVLGAGLLYLLNPGTSVLAWVFLNIPIGIGTGMLFPALGLSIQAASEPALNGQAAAFFSFLRTFGQALGVAVSGVIFQNAFRTNLGALPAFASVADQYSRDATAIVSLINAMPDGGPRDQLVQAFADALKVLWLSLVAFAAVGMALGATIKAYSLEQEHVTAQGIRTGQESPRTHGQGDVESGLGSKTEQ